jgi:RNA recognition motif-containing protein
VLALPPVPIAPQERDRTVNIFVGNLPYTTRDEDLRELFSQFGQVDSASVIMDRATGRSRGFGFVEMPNRAEAEAAIAALNGKPYNNRTLNVNEARPRADRGQRDFQRRW